MNQQSVFNYEVPVVKIEEDTVVITSDDASLSSGLRVFEKYDSSIRDALWVLFSKPDSTLVNDVYSFMNLEVMLRVKDSRCAPYADLDIVTKPNLVVIPPTVGAFPIRLRDVLSEMSDLTFKSQELECAIIGEENNNKIKLINNTWLDVIYVRSMLDAMIHSSMIVEGGMSHASINKLNGKNLNRDDYMVMDFLTMNFDGEFDPNYLVKLKVKDGSMIDRNIFGDFLEKLDPLSGRIDCLGSTEGKKRMPINSLRNFLEDAEKLSPGFFSYLFYFLYPEPSSILYSKVFETISDQYYDSCGSDTLDIFTAIADKEYDDKGKLSVLNENGEYKLIEYNEVEIEIVNNLNFKDYKENLVGDRNFPEIHRFSYVKELKKRLLYKYKIEDSAFSEHYANASRYKRDFIQSTVDWANSFSSLSLGSDYTRILRLCDDSVRDKVSNQMSELFPGHYDSIYNSVLARGLNQSDGIITNTSNVLKRISDAGLYRNGKLDLISNLSDLFKGGDEKVTLKGKMIIYDFCSDPLYIFDSSYYLDETELDGDSLLHFHKKWFSNVLFWDGFNEKKRAELISLIQKNDFNCGLFKIGMPNGMATVDFFYNLFCMSCRSFEFVPSNKPHEPFFFLKVWKEKQEIDLKRRLTTVAKIFNSMHYSWSIGIAVRHNLWFNKMPLNIGLWNSFRMRHIKNLGYIATEVTDKINILVKNTHFVVNPSNRGSKNQRNKAMKEKMNQLMDRMKMIDLDAVLNNIEFGNSSGGTGVR